MGVEQSALGMLLAGWARKARDLRIGGMLHGTLHLEVVGSGRGVIIVKLRQEAIRLNGRHILQYGECSDGHVLVSRLLTRGA